MSERFQIFPYPATVVLRSRNWRMMVLFLVESIYSCMAEDTTTYIIKAVAPKQMPHAQRFEEKIVP
jgi:hypothetical protein